ncbi:MAG: arsenosugar biosynthesis radical SAM (seleno)protein ArsS [Candidatus Omnitrophota bacterium]
MNAFAAKVSAVNKRVMCRSKLKILQVNMGNLCNQQCRHCHVNASPHGKNVMTKETIDDVLKFLSYDKGLILDITGGAPEMNPDFEYFVRSVRKIVEGIIVRSNLTVIFEPSKEYLPSFYKENRIHLICSLPCYTKENVEAQRGSGIFEKSIKALQILNEQGYGRDPGLIVDLVYNPGGAFLPAPQEKLEKDYKRELKKGFGIEFNRLATITNAPINRFKEQLEAKNGYDEYIEMLEDNFNKEVVENIMCRTLLSVGWDGVLYDCDFNQAEGMAIKDENDVKLNVGSVKPDDLTGKELLFGDHCFSCTAGSGSSCQGALEENVGEESFDKTRDMVREYYGETLSTKDDLKTSACCITPGVPAYIKKISGLIEPEIISKFYGCGSPIPLELKEKSILDLGCGSGKDTYLASHLAGEEGNVVGVDMTQEQLDVAEKYVAKHTEKFGFNRTNIRFLKGYIEDLKSIGLEDNTFDVVISNCVVNLSPRKDLVFSEVFRVLKQGGEFYFSDIFVDRRLPEWTKEDPALVGECLGGALFWKDFEGLAKEAGFRDCRIYSKSKMELANEEIKNKVGFANFVSVTYRLFKLDGLEDGCEDYGQTAKYKGGIEHSPNEFKLDNDHIFRKEEGIKVCGNTAAMLQMTRFARYFDIGGNKDVHYGLFPACGSHDPFAGGETCETDEESDSDCGCC